jgi:putative ABC transport system substrate-binding protein
MVMDETVINKNALEYIILFSIEKKIPVMGLSSRFVQKGALFSLFSDYYDLGCQAGELVEQILRGISPNKLPVAFPQKTKLALNLRTASLIGVKLPSDIVEKAGKIYR